MSESSKMGLFGSKDKTKELKKEAASKEESPDRYAPYCIDSDSETYDTEALSIMDINDIIGVHSEPVGDSTLESEIAALSQIITESKTEPTRSITDAMSHIHGEEQIETNRSHESDSLEFSESLDSKSVDMPSNSNKVQVLGEKSIDNNRLEVVGLNRSGNVHSSSSVSIGESCNKYAITDGILQTARSSNKVSSSSDISNKSTSHLNSTTPTLTNAGGISQSLQLIGEAYISEDSQESTSNDNETKDDMDSSYVFKIEHQVEPTESKEMSNTDQSAAECTQDAVHVTATQETVQTVESNSDIIKTAEVVDVAQPAKNNEDVESVKEICLDADKGDNTNRSTKLVHSDVETIRDEENAKQEAVSKGQGEETCKPDSDVVITEETREADNNVVITGETCQADSDVVIPEETCEANSDVVITEDTCEADGDAVITEDTCETDGNAVITEDTCEADGDAVITEDTCEADGDAVITEDTCETDGNAVITEDTCEADSNAVITEDTCEADSNAVIAEETSVTEDTDRVQSIENSKDKVQESVNEVIDKEPAVKSEELQNIENEITTEDSGNTATVAITATEIEEKTDIANDKPTLITDEKTNVKDIGDSKKIKDNTNALSPHPVVPAMSESLGDDSVDVKECGSSRDEADKECGNSNICIPTEEEELRICKQSLLEGPTADGAEYSNTEESNKQSDPDITDKVEEPVTEDEATVTMCDTVATIEHADAEVTENKTSESIEIRETISMATNEESSKEIVTTTLNAATESDDKSEVTRIEPQTDIQSTVEDSRENEIIIKTDSKVQISESIADGVSISETTEQGTEYEKLGERDVVEEIGETSSAAPPAIDEKSEEVSLTQEPEEVSQDSVVPTHSTPVLSETDCLSSDANNVKTIECEEISMVANAFECEKEEASDTSLKKSQDTDDISHNEFKEQVDDESKDEISEEAVTVGESEPAESFTPADALSENIGNDTTAEDETIARTTLVEGVESGTLPEISESNEIEEGNAVKTEEESATIEKEVSDPINIEPEIADHAEEGEEEASCEEMSLTLEPDESDLQGTVESDSRMAEGITMTVESAFEQMDGSTGSAEKEIDSLSADVDDKTTDIPKCVTPEEPADGNLTEILCSPEAEVSDKDIQDIAKSQDIEESLKPDVDDGSLKSILENASNVAEMFAEEQCQNTQDIMSSILENDVTDFKNILGTENSVENDIDDVLQHSAELPNLVEGEIEELAKKLPGISDDMLNKDMEEAAQNMDSLEGLLGLDLMPENEESVEKEKSEDSSVEQPDNIEKDVEMSLLLDANRESVIEQDTDYITDVISSCLTNDEGENLPGDEGKLSTDAKIVDKETEGESTDIIKIGGNIIDETIVKNSECMNMESELVEGELQEADLDMDFQENPLESVEGLEEEQKLELSQDILLGSANHSEDLNDPATGIETSQPSSEISELESAVKFLQESEEQAIDSPLVLSPKLVESVVDDMSKQSDAGLFVPDEDICEDTSELVAELQGIGSDSISISEAEIISEAAKLENERKLAEQAKLTSTVAEFPNSVGQIKLNTDEILSEPASLEASDNINSLVEEIPSEILTELPTESPFDTAADSLTNTLATLPIEVSSEKAELQTRCQIASKTSESLPKTSILEERLKEPPKIEIPVPEVSKMCSSPTTPKDSLLIQKDAKMSAYQKMLESPKHYEKGETKITDTPRKDSEKHDFENVGSPRIILKIVKSAIADCGEPRSPKSPKIRSATNSPNPEDSPGQKLGKIKLKLSKGGHPSIISNENVEESGQWHTEGSSSLSPIGMKIKLSKSGDVSIVSSDKHESSDDLKESKRTESPIGMKFKLSKSGDASIVQQDANITKHKEKLDIIQSSPKRTESPIGMKIKLSKSGDASIIQPDKQESQEEHKEVSCKSKDKLDATCELPKRTESPIGMKIKLSKTGDPSIIPSDLSDETKEVLKMKEKLESSPEMPKRTESPIGMKIKLAKTKSGASIISVENAEDCRERLEVPDAPKRTDSPLGMKIKLSKSGDASIIHSEVQEELKEMKHKEKFESSSECIKQMDVGTKIKVIKPPDTTSSTESTEQHETNPEAIQRPESSLGMKIKLSKTGDASIIPSDKMEHEEEQKLKEAHLEIPKRTESPLGMKIKLSKTGDASIIQSETGEDPNRVVRRTEAEYQKAPESALGMKIKLVKTGDTSIVDVDKKDKQPRRRDVESPLEMKIKLSKTGHPTIVACDNHGDASHKSKEALEGHNFANRYKDSLLIKEPALKILKAGHSSIMQTNRSELTIEPVQMPSKKVDPSIEISPKRKEITISPIETKKSKLEAQLSQILPEVTIQPVMSRDQKQLLFDPKTSLISRQQMNVISQEISITQVRPPKPGTSEVSMSDKLKDILCKNATNSPLGSDCEIIEHRPELIIVNENSNSSQDVVIIEEVPPIRMPDAKVPKKRGRPRRNPLPPQLIHQPTQLLIPRDPLALDEMPAVTQFEQRENERPKRTCRNQKSYAPPKRGRGRGRGKRKLEAGLDLQGNKKPRVEQDLTAIEASTMAVITLDEHSAEQDALKKSSELYKALKQPTMDHKIPSPCGRIEKQALTLVRKSTPQKGEMTKVLEIGPKGILMEPSALMQLDPNKVAAGSQEYCCKTMARPAMGVPLEVKSDTLPESEQKPVEKSPADDKVADKSGDGGKQISAEGKDILTPPGHPNWLTPTSKKPADNAARTETMSTVQVIDEETRMSAESGSRSQTPARNIPAPATDQTIVNEESQGSVLSTATTESEKVKVKNRRMEINFDPDEGPFTVDKIAEYEWPLDRKGETFMIQEQISQYLGVKSFKRKYPDLKRRMVDMEERNYLRENGLVSEAMCDMGLTAVCSSEVLDVMCSDFPDQYEEYRKHMREKQVKEHSKKQKELTAAANAEKNRIDLAEMAVQSALSWNVSLNKARKESRKCSLDLQTFTIHVPKKQQKVETDRKHSHYPVALIPGQYTDYYREYTPAELRYYPLNTVLYGPMRPNERKFDSQSEGSQSDSDSDSSSDDSSSSSSEGTQDTEGSQSTMDDVDMEIATQKEEVKLKCKMCLKSLNKHSKSEVLIQCGTCGGNGNVAVHPSCIDLTLDMVPHIQSYAWQCTDCKTCAQCHDPADEDKMLFCDMCDRGYHIYCVGLRRVPQGRWHCQECAVCANCGSREPGGANSDRNSVAQWQHEYKKGDKNTRVYVSTLCVPCSKLWRKGRYCPHCSRCHTAQRPDLEVSLVHCSACDKYLHLGCVETKGAVFDRKNYLCDFCAPAKPLMSKTVKM